MCDIKSDFNEKTGEAKVICTITGKPITVANDYGMYCEDLCGMDRDKELDSKMDELFKMLRGL